MHKYHGVHHPRFQFGPDELRDRQEGDALKLHDSCGVQTSRARLPGRKNLDLSATRRCYVYPPEDAKLNGLTSIGGINRRYVACSLQRSLVKVNG